MPRKTEQSSLGKQEMYDLSSPLWESYFHETRKKARFPRGYKEVSSFDTAKKEEHK